MFNHQKKLPESDSFVVVNLTCDWQIDATWHRLSLLLNNMAKIIPC